MQECDLGWLAGWADTQPPSPVAVLSWGEASAAMRAGLREEVPVSVLSPRLVGRKQRFQALGEQTRDPLLAMPPEGTKALALTQSHVGADIIEPVNPMPGVGMEGPNQSLSLTFQIWGWVCAVGIEAAQDPQLQSPHFNFLPGTPPPTSPCYLLL